MAARVGTLSLALRNVSSSGFETIDRVSLQDLGGGELSETLAQEVANQKSAENEKLANIEKLVKDVGDNLNSRINQLENKKPTVVKKRNTAIIRPTVKKPAYSVVGVTRSGKRSEYRFEADE